MKVGQLWVVRDRRRKKGVGRVERESGMGERGESGKKWEGKERWRWNCGREGRRMEEDSGGKGLSMQGMKWEMKRVDTWGGGGGGGGGEEHSTE